MVTRAGTRIVYGLGGYDPAKPDGNIVEQHDVEVTVEPDVEGLLDAVDVQMGPAFTRRMLKDFPDVERALSRGRINRAWAGLRDAYDAGDITAEEWATLVGLAAEHGIDAPEQ